MYLAHMKGIGKGLASLKTVAMLKCEDIIWQNWTEAIKTHFES